MALEVANVIRHQDELADQSLFSIKRQVKALAAQSGSTLRRFAHAAGVRKSMMSYWLGQPGAKLSLSRMILFAQALKIPLLSFLSAHFHGAQIPAFTAIQPVNCRACHRHVSESEVSTLLEQALRIGQTSSSVASKLGVDKMVIRDRNPGLYDLVNANNKALRSQDRRHQIDRARDRYCDLSMQKIWPTARKAGYVESSRGSTEAVAFQLIRMRCGETHLTMPAKANRFTVDDWEYVERAVQAIKEKLASGSPVT